MTDETNETTTTEGPVDANPAVTETKPEPVFLRREAGRIIGIYANCQPGFAEEKIDGDHPDVRNWLIERGLVADNGEPIVPQETTEAELAAQHPAVIAAQDAEARAKADSEAQPSEPADPNANLPPPTSTPPDAAKAIDG